MKAYKLYYILITGLFFLIPSHSWAQNFIEASSQADVETYKSKVKDLVAFLEYAMNTIGSSDTPTRDKNVIITQSYLKVFKNSKVQIEDDLNENRDMITHKDVHAYLSDIDFFFKDVKFEFMIEDISYFRNANNQIYYLVTLTRNLKGITIENESINSNLIRYIEVNLNETDRDLKIASIYTSKISEEEELSNWWQNLPYPWTDILRKQLPSAIGQMDGRQLQELVNLENLDLSAYPELGNIEPISKLTNLRRVDVSGTQIRDLIPLRNLTKLDFLDCSNTQIRDLESLKYALELRVLRFDSTRVSNTSVLSTFTNLEQLSASHTYVNTLSDLSGLQRLKKLDVSKTRIRTLEGLESLHDLDMLNCSSNNIKSLEPLSNLKELRTLQIDNTLVTTLEPLKDLDNLRTLSCNNTLITTLKPLNSLPNLERVYSDNTLMVSSDAKNFITQHPQVLVVYGTESLRNWWNQLTEPWQAVLGKAAGLRGTQPSREEMARIANITKVDVSGIGEVVSLEPVKILKNLKEIKFESTGVTSLAPLRGLVELEHVDASNTAINELYSLENLPKLRLLGIDNTQVRPQEINRFINNHPQCLVMYKTARLLKWWGEMPTEWRSVLKSQFDHREMSAKQRLHTYINLEKLYFKTSVSDLEPVREFIKLKELGFSGTRISSLEPLRNMGTLEVLRCSQSPINSLEPIRHLRRLKVLNFEDTLVDDLESLEDLKGLSELKFSGTQVKDLKAISNLTNLKEIECYNTDVKSLKPIEGLRGLRNLKCYNTKINARSVESFRKAVPQCNIVYY